MKLEMPVSPSPALHRWERGTESRYASFTLSGALRDAMKLDKNIELADLLQESSKVCILLSCATQGNLITSLFYP